MAQQHLLTYFSVIVYLTILTSLVQSFTDPLDVTALNNLYSTLNYPPELQRWRKDGGDPCEESWTGVSCYGASVIYLKLHGLNLTGSLGGQLNNLHNLKQLDVSSNRIMGKIPSNLPLNATHINMASNHLSQNIPETLSYMQSLRHLNLSHNTLSGPVGNFFTGLLNLREMDLSYNNFSEDLPSSFGSLANVSRLFLQKNKFTGSVAYLSDLPLIDLNIQDNCFSGVIPENFQAIPNLWIGGNKFHMEVNSPPWDFPLERAPMDQNISGPPTTQSNAIESYPSRNIARNEKKRLGPGGIVLIVGGVTLVVTFAALFGTIRMKKVRESKRSLKIANVVTCSPPFSRTEDGSFTALEESSQVLPLSSPPTGGSRPTALINHTRTEKVSGRKGFSKRCRIPVRTKIYTLEELQSATNNYSEDNLLGEGSLGSVYKAEFPDGQVLAVKNINMIALSIKEEEQFLDVVWTASRLRHPNIVTLIGYCIEHGQHLLVYEYVRNLSLDDALHCEAYTSLSWTVRLQIALGVARALDYLHTNFFPPFSHCNLKAANILLDEELLPRISDCGLDAVRQLESNRVIKASEIAISDRGYLPPEHGQVGNDNTKIDVYSFGVLLLELVTGRKPFDDLKPKKEQLLVKWASFRLHDNESLEEMVDPGIKGTFSSKALSRFVDIISLCIQPVKEFRPPMSEIVESLTHLQRTMEMAAAEGTEVDPFDKSFNSTKTAFVGSPRYDSFSPTSF